MKLFEDSKLLGNNKFRTAKLEVSESGELLLTLKSSKEQRRVHSQKTSEKEELLREVAEKFLDDKRADFNSEISLSEFLKSILL